MGRSGWKAAVAALAVAAVAGCDAGPSETERARIAEEMDGFVASLFEAMNAHDVAAISSHYDGSPDFVYVGCTAVRTGFESLRRLMEMWHRARPAVTFEPEVLTVRAITGDVATVTARATTSEEDTLYWSFILHRGGDGWRIVHEHESWPDCPEQRPHPSV